MMKNAFSQSRQFVPPVFGRVRGCQQNAGAAFGERFLHLIETERDIAGAARKTERVERAAFKAGFNGIGEIVGRVGFRFKGARKKTL